MLRLSLAVGDYDINRALVRGEVAPQGVQLTTLVLPSPERHARMVLHREFDACELSMATYLALHEAEPARLTAIPAFPHRRFRHGYLFVTDASPITDPHQLNGRRIGIRSWQTTAGLWLRGILQDEHDVDLASIEWVAQDAEDVPLRHAGRFRISRVPPGGSVVGMLAAGELDALVYPELPAPRPGGPAIRPLFGDPKAAEIAYHRRTGIFPIMHTVVLRRSLAAEQPWLPRELLTAFRASKDAAFAAMRDPRRVSLAWLTAALEEQERELGPDPWAYQLEANRATLETLVRYAHEQGLVGRPVPVDELFEPSTRDEPPTYV